MNRKRVELGCTAWTIGLRDCHSELCVADVVPSCLSGRRSCRGLHIRAAFPGTAAALYVASSRRRT